LSEVSLEHNCHSKNVDVAREQEPYTRQGLLVGIDCEPIRIAKTKVNDIHGIWAAIIVFNPNLEIIEKVNLKSTHTVVLSVSFPSQEPIDLVSSYFQYRRPTVDFTNEIASMIENISHNCIMCLDVNAFSPRWHDKRRNDKGILVEEMIDRLNLYIKNKPGNAWTFNGPRGTSNVDITLSTEDMDTKITDWVCLSGETTSDHSLITFKIVYDI